MTKFQKVHFRPRRAPLHQKIPGTCSSEINNSNMENQKIIKLKFYITPPSEEGFVKNEEKRKTAVLDPLYIRNGVSDHDENMLFGIPIRILPYDLILRQFGSYVSRVGAH